MNYFYKNKSDTVDLYDSPIELLKTYCRNGEYHFYKTCNINAERVSFSKITKEELSVEELLAECRKYVERQVTVKRKLNAKYKESTLYYHTSNKKTSFTGEAKGLLLRGDNSVNYIKSCNINASVIGDNNIICLTSDFSSLIVNGDCNTIIVNSEFFYNGIIVNGENNHIFVQEDVVTVRGTNNFIMSTGSTSIDVPNSNYIVSLGKYACIRAGANNIIKIRADYNEVTCGGNNVIHSKEGFTTIETSSLQGEIKVSDDSVVNITWDNKRYSFMNSDFKQVLGTTIVSSEGLKNMLDGQV